MFCFHTGVCLLALYGVFMFFLVSPLTPVSVVWTLREWNVLFVIAGRVRYDLNQSVCVCTFARSNPLFVCTYSAHPGRQ